MTKNDNQYEAAWPQEKNMQKSDRFAPAIAWRSALDSNPDREPVEIDVRDGRAEYVLSGPYRMTEGATIEVREGQVIWSSGRTQPT